MRTISTDLLDLVPVVQPERRLQPERDGLLHAGVPERQRFPLGHRHLGEPQRLLRIVLGQVERRRAARVFRHLLDVGRRLHLGEPLQTPGGRVDITPMHLDGGSVRDVALVETEPGPSELVGRDLIQGRHELIPEAERVLRVDVSEEGGLPVSVPHPA